ncbi:hypothetical protein [Aquabacterium sp. A08]|uniref:hypothetical protein n=1 Tax=Aquabacterium sp. A08 TaxID=2718532 RepID=UPI001AAE69BC|nr:hypothetical protein [Aquabacterium sp. A08]
MLTSKCSQAWRSPKAWLWSAAAALALSAAGGAQATDVYWSIGVHQPGVHVGVSNAPPVVVHTTPRVVHVSPRVVYGPPPVVVVPHPVYRTGWAPPGHHKHKHGYKHRDRDRHWDDDHRRDGRHGGRDDRHDRWDDRRDHRR